MAKVYSSQGVAYNTLDFLMLIALYPKRLQLHSSENSLQLNIMTMIVYNNRCKEHHYEQ